VRTTNRAIDRTDGEREDAEHAKDN
jgi:hypothetical protein